MLETIGLMGILVMGFGALVNSGALQWLGIVLACFAFEFTIGRKEGWHDPRNSIV